MAVDYKSRSDAEGWWHTQEWPKNPNFVWNIAVCRCYKEVYSENDTRGISWNDAKTRAQGDFIFTREDDALETEHSAVHRENDPGGNGAANATKTWTQTYAKGVYHQTRQPPEANAGQDHGCDWRDENTVREHNPQICLSAERRGCPVNE